jgi:endonuclease/exonuclease/phosphatase family metal-dependent hydrolase
MNNRASERTTPLEAADIHPAKPPAAGSSRARRRALALTLSVLLTGAGCAHVYPATGDRPDSSLLSCRGVVPAADVAVVWSGPSSPRQSSGLARWCAAVGPVLFKPVPRVVPPGAVDRLAVVSWNVHVGSGDVADFVRQLRGGQFTAGDPVDHFVLLLQEAYRRDSLVPPQIPRGFPAPGRIAARTGRGPDIERIADDLGLAVFYVPSMRNGITSVDAEDRGNAILSTLPLNEARVIELPLEHQRRAVAVATIEGRTSPGATWRLRLADVHLDTALALLHGGPFAARRRQADALVQALAEPDAVPTVVAGDFNTWRGSTEPALTLLRQAFPQTPPPPALPTWNGPLGIHARLDHMFLRGPFPSAAVVRLPSRFASDHYPILVVLRF